MSDVCRLLADDLPLPPGVPGGMESYRRTLTTSFFFKFYLSVLMRLQQEVKNVVCRIRVELGNSRLLLVIT